MDDWLIGKPPSLALSSQGGEGAEKMDQVQQVGSQHTAAGLTASIVAERT